MGLLGLAREKRSLEASKVAAEELPFDMRELHESFGPMAVKATKSKPRVAKIELLPRGVAQNVAGALSPCG